jgi:hypothetical protein
MNLQMQQMQMSIIMRSDEIKQKSIIQENKIQELKDKKENKEKMLGIDMKINQIGNKDSN